MDSLIKIVTPKNYNYADFKRFSNFRTGKQFNSNNEIFLAEHKKDLTATEYIAFKRFIKLAYNDVLGLYGVVHAGVNYIVKQINNFDLECTKISRSTVRRMLAKIKGFNLTKVVPCESESGKQRPNLYIFQKFGQTEPPKSEPVGEITSVCEPIERPIEDANTVEHAPQQQKDFSQLNTLNTDINSNTNKLLNINTRTQTRLDHSYISEKNFNKFIETSAPFFNYKGTKELIKAVKQNTRNYKRMLGYEHFDDIKQEIIDNKIEDVATKALKNTIEVVIDKKNTKNRIENNIGLFVKIFRNKLAISNIPTQVKPPKKKRDTSFYYNWLESDERGVLNG